MDCQHILSLKNYIVKIASERADTFVKNAINWCCDDVGFGVFVETGEMTKSFSKATKEALREILKEFVSNTINDLSEDLDPRETIEIDGVDISLGEYFIDVMIEEIKQTNGVWL